MFWDDYVMGMVGEGRGGRQGYGTEEDVGGTTGIVDNLQVGLRSVN